MRRSFFLTIFAMTTATVFLVSYLQYSFFRHERGRLIDRQIETVASALIASRLSVELMENLNQVDAIIQKTVVGNPIDLVINIYSDDGDNLYSNNTGERLGLQLVSTAKWQNIETPQHMIRALTLHNGRIYVQVGLILDSTLDRWKLDTHRFIFFLCLIVLLVGAISYASARFLFRPISKLANEFQILSGNLNRQLGQPLTEFVIPPTLAEYSRDREKKDELETLATEIRNFLKMLGDYTKSFQAQTALLTHEIKTPLTVIVNRLEEMQRTPIENSRPLLDQAKKEVLDLAAMVNNYLQWAVFITSPGKPTDVYAVKLAPTVEETVKGLETIYGSRIQLEISDSTTVFAYPEHVRQIVKNVVENALKYSPGEVKVNLNAERLAVSDVGAGIPKEILSAIGTPFNNSKGADPQRSSGLGLAWVHVICQKYGWDLKIDSDHKGARIEIHFKT